MISVCGRDIVDAPPPMDAGSCCRFSGLEFVAIAKEFIAIFVMEPTYCAHREGCLQCFRVDGATPKSGATVNPLSCSMSPMRA